MLLKTKYENWNADYIFNIIISINLVNERI